MSSLEKNKKDRLCCRGATRKETHIVGLGSLSFSEFVVVGSGLCPRENESSIFVVDD